MRKVALFFNRSSSYVLDMILGISKYSSLHSNWELYFPPPVYLENKIIRDQGDSLSWFKECNPDGVIMVEPEGSRNILETGVPAIIGSYMVEDFPDLCHFGLDDVAVGKMAVEYFVNRGFKRLAFCGQDYYLWSNGRQKGFNAAAKQHSLEIYYYNTPKSHRKYPLKKELDFIG